MQRLSISRCCITVLVLYKYTGQYSSTSIIVGPIAPLVATEYSYVLVLSTVLSTEYYIPLFGTSTRVLYEQIERLDSRRLPGTSTQYTVLAKYVLRYLYYCGTSTRTIRLYTVSVRVYEYSTRTVPVYTSTVRTGTVRVPVRTVLN